MPAIPSSGQVESGGKKSVLALFATTLQFLAPSAAKINPQISRQFHIAMREQVYFLT